MQALATLSFEHILVIGIELLKNILKRLLPIKNLLQMVKSIDFG